MLPAPNLDDRRFQDLVDDAKRFVQQRCPEWSDHNVSDPGVTLIELFAQMTDQIVYRLNRVPDRNYIKFLELIGVRLFPPQPAKTGVTFWLSSIPTEVRHIRSGTNVSTRRTEVEAPVVFSTVESLDIIPVSQIAVRSSVEEDKTRSHDDDLLRGTGFTCFASPPKPGDALYIGLSDPAPRNAVVLTITASIDGIGVDPLRPPLVWEAWNGEDWEHCDVDSDSTGGLNRAGEVVVHLPRGHAASVIAKQRAAWVRARVIEPDDERPVYSSSPIISAVRVHTIGGTSDAIHAQVIDESMLGSSDGSAGQRFALEVRPIVRHDETYVEVSGDDGWQRWTEVTQFADSGPDDRHYLVDGTLGEIAFGPVVRMEDGSLRGFGAVPPKGSAIRMRHAAVGGGEVGNVNAKAITVLTSSIPYVERVENRHAALGGRDAESIENAKIRGPISLRSRGRAVTVEDFEEHARQAAPEVARVRCVPAGTDDVSAGGVRVLLVPSVPAEAGRIRFEQLLPTEDSMRRISDELDRRRLVGTRVSVEPPVYHGITVVARVRATAGSSTARVQEQALTALYRYFNPLEGGPNGTGWPFGRPLLIGEVFAVLQRLPGVAVVEDARMFAADPITGQRGQAAQRIDITANGLVFSYDHQVMVEAEG